MVKIFRSCSRLADPQRKVSCANNPVIVWGMVSNRIEIVMPDNNRCNRCFKQLEVLFVELIGIQRARRCLTDCPRKKLGERRRNERLIKGEVRAQASCENLRPRHTASKSQQPPHSRE